MGDVIEKITKTTGIDKVVEWIAGEDCGCDERKEKFNKIRFHYRYANVECMSQVDHDYWTKFKDNHSQNLSADDADMVEAIWNRLFNAKKRRIRFCRSCTNKWQKAIDDINLIYNEYGKDTK